MQNLNEKETDEINEDENIFYAGAIFGKHEKRGLVRLSYGLTFDIVVNPSEARFIAMSILEAAEAAQTDEFIMNWLRDQVGISDEEKRVLVLRDFRQVRVEMAKRDLENSKNNL